MTAPDPRWRASPVSVVVLAVVCAACTSSPPPEDREGGSASGESPAEPAELPDRSEFVGRALDLEVHSREDLRRELSEPDSTARETVPNRHVPGVQDTIFTVYYPDLVVRIHHPGGGGDLVSMIQVSSDRHLRYPVIGLPTQRIEEALGKPDEASDSALVYYCTSCEAGDDPVELLLNEGEVRRVRFNYYVD